MVQFTHYVIFAKINGIFIKEPVVQNPYKLVYKVLKYIWQNKHPQCRSAFTYCEDELPSCMNFGKRKDGGPFTTEYIPVHKFIIYPLSHHWMESYYKFLLGVVLQIVRIVNRI